LTEENGVAVSIVLTGDVIEAFPQAQVRFVVARGLNNAQEWQDSASRLDELAERVAAGRWSPFDESSPEIASWHDAYRKFGTNPRRFRPSVDALSRRLTKNGALPRINGAVDTYNFVSVSYGTPAGAFDLGLLDGTIEIRFARPGDTFTPLGEPDKTEPLTGGEVVYASASEVLTRHWNHRDCEQTKVTADSSDVVFIVERISADAVPTDVLTKAQEEIGAFVAPHAARIAFAVVSADAPAANLIEA
jgi:DNA/RNA-binding domain of Phe-tRNA-synthetase-like protein